MVDGDRRGDAIDGEHVPERVERTVHKQRSVKAQRGAFDMEGVAARVTVKREVGLIVEFDRFEFIDADQTVAAIGSIVDFIGGAGAIDDQAARNKIDDRFQIQDVDGHGETGDVH